MDAKLSYRGKELRNPKINGLPLVPDSLKRRESGTQDRKMVQPTRCLDGVTGGEPPLSLVGYFMKGDMTSA